MKEEAFKICKDRILWRSIGGEIVILDLDKDNYYSLNETGSLVWELVGKGIALSKISDAVSAKYKISKKTAEKDVRSVVDKFKKEKLIVDR